MTSLCIPALLESTNGSCVVNISRCADTQFPSFVYPPWANLRIPLQHRSSSSRSRTRRLLHCKSGRGGSHAPNGARVRRAHSLQVLDPPHLSCARATPFLALSLQLHSPSHHRNCFPPERRNVDRRRRSVNISRPNDGSRNPNSPAPSTPRYYAASSATHPVGRCGDAHDVAELVLFLADPRKSGFCTGSVFPCDGGRLLPIPLAPQWQKT
jgi:hypothetical protein